MTIADIFTLLGAVYSVASILGHAPFMPAKAKTFLNALAFNLKGFNEKTR